MSSFELALKLKLAVGRCAVRFAPSAALQEHERAHPHLMRQVSDGLRPVEFNGGKPEDYAAGFWRGMQLGKIKCISTSFTADVQARHTGHKHMSMVVVRVHAR